VKVIVGLGNPGVHYRWSRHNVGFQVVDRLAETCHISICTKRFKTLYGKGWIDSKEVVLVKPLTYMNRSGEAVKEIVRQLAPDLMQAQWGGIIQRAVMDMRNSLQRGH
jgi:PTH1 family peptidyl-tRNA hydrolase